MNLMLHWLRRDLQRHAPWLLLWALLVSLFTAARIWLRTHPGFVIGDRDLWLSVPAGTLGLAETCLILHLVLDDPVRGPHSFWKTRPPSGGAVFAAKAVLVCLIALLIPLAGDVMFLWLAAPSGGLYERVALYFLPTVLAVSAGAAASTWRRVLIWLPVVIILLWGCAALFALLMLLNQVLYLAEPFLFMSGAFLTVLGCALAGYIRRCAGKYLVVSAAALPGLAAVTVAGTGWSLDSRVNAAPHGINPSQVRVTWTKQPQPLSRSSQADHVLLEIPLSVTGVPAGQDLRGKLYDVEIIPKGGDPLRPQVRRESVGIWKMRDHAGLPSRSWFVAVSPTDANEVKNRPCRVHGVLSLLFANREPRRIPLSGTHFNSQKAPGWATNIASDSADSVSYAEFTPHGDIAPSQTLIRFDPGTASLHHTGGPEVLPLSYFPEFASVRTWEGVGTMPWNQRFNFSDQMNAAERHWRHLLSTDPKARAGWELHFDVLTPAGRLDVPFTLEVTPRETSPR